MGEVSEARESGPLVNRLVALDVRELSLLVIESGGILDGLRGQEWLGLVQVFTAKLIAVAETLTETEWPACASAIDCVLSRAETAEVIDHHESSIRRLNLTAALLLRLPPRQDIAIRNPATMIEIFLAEVPLPAEEALTLLPNWRNRDISVIRRLRQVKNLFRPLLETWQILAERGFAAELDGWKQLYPKLP